MQLDCSYKGITIPGNLKITNGAVEIFMKEMCIFGSNLCRLNGQLLVAMECFYGLYKNKQNQDKSGTTFFKE